MTRQHEKVLIAALAGLVLVCAATFAVSPTLAAGYAVDMTARVSGVASWDELNVRKWPASYSQKTGALAPGVAVWVERCIIIEGASDWCRVERGSVAGWVNSRYLAVVPPEEMGDF
jgi:SH3-like domain-containing protein